MTTSVGRIQAQDLNPDARRVGPRTEHKLNAGSTAYRQWSKAGLARWAISEYVRLRRGTECRATFRRTVRWGLLTAALVAGLAGCPTVRAQDFTKKAVKIMVTGPGGSSDALSRVLAEELADVWSNPVIVDNKPGAGGVVATIAVEKAPPDGHSILVNTTAFIVSAETSRTPLYDPIAGFAPVALLGKGPLLLVARPQLPESTLPQLLARARLKPDTLTYGTAGVGAIAHMTFEAMASLAGIRMRHVPYKGSSQALTDVLGGSIDVTSSNPVVSAPLIRAGRLRALVTGGASRYPGLPEVPTFTEAGLPGFEPSDWKAWLGPKGIPPKVVARLNSEVNAILKEKEFAAVLESDGSMPVGGTPAQLLALIKSDMERWRALVRDRQIKLE